MIRIFMVALIALLLPLGAIAQVGGNGVSKGAGSNSATGVLGFNQTVSNRAVNPSWLCAGAPLTTNNQVRQYIVIYSASGQPYYVPAC